MRIQNKALKITIRILIILLITASALAIAGYTFLSRYKPFDPETAFTFHTVSYDDVTKSVLTTGHIKPSETIYVSVETAQKVSQVLVKEGDPVKQGDVLITYDVAKDRQDIERKIATARLNIENGRLNLNALTLPAEGNELLQYSGEITAAEYNVSQADNTINSLDNKASQAQKQVDQAQRQIEQQQNIIDQQQQAVDRASDEAERAKALYDVEALPWVTYDETLKALEAAQLQLNAAQLQKSGAETALESAMLTLDELAISRESALKTLETGQKQLGDAQEALNNALNRASTDAVSIKYKQQEIGIQLIEQQITQYEVDLALYTDQSVASADGIISKVNIKDGATASKGASLIELDVVNETLAEAEVTEFDAPLLSLGMDADIVTSGLPDSVFKGTITKIAAGAITKEKASGDEVVVPVRFTLVDTQHKLKVGYSVDIEIYTERRDNVLCVPAQTLFAEGDTQSVFVYDGETLAKAPVTVGFYGDANVEIINGVAPSDRIVTNPSGAASRTGNWFTDGLDTVYGFLKQRF
ncbi:MAG: biotin/lipoyl-binding protein [Clostridiales bacterium]|jgi:HlyD family secretion protein|nr:biotin/lipoyl-binding protein [Clostridiales bacterium]